MWQIRYSILCFSQSGEVSSYDTSLYVEQSNYRYIRGQDVKPFLLQDTSPRYMEERDFNRLNKYALATNDILISVVGTLGKA